MIRIEGIPVVAARLADAGTSKLTQTRSKRRGTSKVEAGGKEPPAVLSALRGKIKVA